MWTELLFRCFPFSHKPAKNWYELSNMTINIIITAHFLIAILDTQLHSYYTMSRKKMRWSYGVRQLSTLSSPSSPHHRSAKPVLWWEPGRGRWGTAYDGHTFHFPEGERNYVYFK